MSDNEVFYDRFVSETEARATIDVPVESIDLGDWVLNLPDAEYQRCAPGEHIAAGRTVSDAGEPMSINVENIGGYLVIQHYVAEVHDRDHCRMVSLSDVQTPQGWIKIHATWELQTVRVDDQHSELINTVTTRPTTSFLKFIEAEGRSFDEASVEINEGVVGHNHRETPLFAESIGRKFVAASA
ncbi:hypothetical protein [Williamsia sp. M5A3_1d]